MRIGIIGGPGAAKSTTAAAVFAECKYRGITVDLIQEYARDQINRGWQPTGIADQFRILNEQRALEDIVPDEIQTVLMDSPTILSYVYALQHNKVETFTDRKNMEALYGAFLEDLDRYDLLVLLRRVKPYVNDGTRSQTAEESDMIYEQVKLLLDLHHVNYLMLDGDKEAVDALMEIIEDDIN